MKRAKEIEEKIVEANPTVPQYLALLADIEQLLTEYTAGPPLTVMKFGSLSDQNKETESMGFARDSVKSWGKLLSLYPGDTLYRRKLAEANYNLAEQAQNSGNARVAISAIDAAKTVVEELNRDLPNNPLTEQLLGLILHNRAAIFRGRGNRLAGEAAAQAVSFVEARLAANQNSLFWLVISAKCRLEEEMVFRADHQTEKAKAALEAAWQHLAKAVALGNTEMITNYLRVAGESLAERKDDSGADAVAKRLSELPLPKGQSYFDAARFRGHYSDNIFLQPDYQDATDAKRRVLQLQYAMQLLNIAIDKGFNNLEALKTTLELGKLREAFEFGALMDRIRVQ
ncbi:MAG: hypothetical protein U0798_01840 [Gemmataceae bacterium]